MLENAGIASAHINLQEEVIQAINPSELSVSYTRIFISNSFGTFGNNQLPFTNIKEFGIIKPINKWGSTLKLFAGNPIYNARSDYRFKLKTSEIGISIAFPIKLMLKNTELRAGIQSAYIIESVRDLLDDDFGKSVLIRSGYNLNHSFNPNFEYINGLTIQYSLASTNPNMLKMDNSFRFYYSNDNRSLALLTELEFTIDKKLRNRSAALSHFSSKYHPTVINIGFSTGIADPLDIELRYLNWLHLGFSTWFKDFQISLNLSEAQNIWPYNNYGRNIIDYKTNSGIISLNINFPIGKKKNNPPKVYNASINYFGTKTKSVQIGKKDTLDLYVTVNADKPVDKQFLYFNTVPATGIRLDNYYVELPELLPGEPVHVPLCLKTVLNNPPQLYDIAIEFPYGTQEKKIIHYPLQTVSPKFEFIYHFAENKRFFFLRENGLYNLDISIKNVGSIQTKGLKVFLSESLKKFGLQISDTLFTEIINPGESKRMRLTINSKNENKLPPRIHFTIIYEELDGHHPKSFGGDFVVLPDNRLLMSSTFSHPLLKNYKDSEPFYCVFSPSVEEYQRIKDKFDIMLVENKYFPGKLVHEIVDMTSALAFMRTLNSPDFEGLYIFNTHDMIDVKSYFLSYDNSSEINEILKLVKHVPVYFDLNNQGKILMGPFTNMKEVILAQEYIDSYIPGESVIITRYPDEIYVY